MKPPVEGYLESGDANTPVGVVLAGGQSRRMGHDKALLSFDGERLVDRAVRRLSLLVSEVVVADRGRALVPGRPSLEDGPGAGPAAAILGAADAFPNRSLLVLACDLPHVPPGMLGQLFQLEGDWVVPVCGGRFQALASLFRSVALDRLRQRVEQGALDLQGLAKDLLASEKTTLGVLDETALAAWGEPSWLFANWNHPEDLPPNLLPPGTQLEGSSGLQSEQGQIERRKSKR